MLMKILKKISWVFLGIVMLYMAARFMDKSIGGIYDAVRAPYLQSASANSMVIRWQTKRNNIGVVRIGEQINELNNVYSEKSADDEHEVYLTNLIPNTKYYYSVGTKHSVFYRGSDYWFKTSPINKNESIRFWLTGDQGLAGVTQSTVRDAMLQWTQQHPINGNSDINFWLTTGDNAYRSGTNKQFQKHFFIPYGNILRNTPVWPAYGNHDARRWTFFNIFTFPTKAEAGGIASTTEKYYSFDYGQLHVVMLDSQSSRLQKNSRMLRWLQKDLSANNRKWLIAVFHHPPYTKGSHNSDNNADSFNRMRNIRKYVLPILEKGGVDVVLSGHSHMYERSWFMNCHYGASDTFTVSNIQGSKPQGDIKNADTRKKQSGMSYNKGSNEVPANRGTIYITLGSSARFDSGALNHQAMPVSLQQSGSMVFDIVDDKLTANFINVDMQVADSFSILKGTVNPVNSYACE